MFYSTKQATEGIRDGLVVAEKKSINDPRHAGKRCFWMFLLLELHMCNFYRHIVCLFVVVFWEDENNLTFHIYLVKSL